MASTRSDTPELEDLARRVLEVARFLNEPVENVCYKLALVALGQQSRTLFRALRQVARGRANAAGGALLRPMVEVNITIRFLNTNPELHTELWQAEGDRSAAAIGVPRQLGGADGAVERAAAGP